MIQFYLIKTDAFYEQALFEKGCGRVDTFRRSKITACRHTEDKVRSLCCGLLLQYGMSLRLAVQDSRKKLELLYGIGPYGKPYLKDYPGLHFSLSHSGAYAGLALSDSPVGLDLQKVRPVKESLAKRVLSAEEYAVYRQSAEEKERTDFFFAGWCARESYGKLNGKGIGQELCRLQYDQHAETIAGVPCRAYRIGKEYYGSLCAEARDFFPEQPEDVTDTVISHILS